MNRIDKKFRDLKGSKKKALIVFVTAGDPSLAATKRIVLELERSGADIIELGIPFSDPLADGPTIQASSYRALKQRATLKRIFNMVGSLRRHTEIPLVFMTYYNPILKYGVKKFFDSCKSYGVDGVIVPDLPCEEAGELTKSAKSRGVATIFLAAPTSTPERIQRIIKLSKGFIYYVSLTGVTGVRSKLPPHIIPNARRIKLLTDKPLAVGFGISNAKQAKAIAGVADGVIVGSAIVKLVSKKGNFILRVSRFVRSLAEAVHVT